MTPPAFGWAGSGSSLLNLLFSADLQPMTSIGDVGVRLGHFVIQDRIGMGAMGAVFRAFDTRLERMVALKVLAPSLSNDTAAVQRFLNEARAAARLDHENVARVFFIGEDQGLHFIAFEYVTGTNVRELIRNRGRIDPADAVNYTLQIAGALIHTDAVGVVHRDIKPSNIIVTPADRAKLVDLGLARKENYDSSPDLTVAGTTLGTFDYISPEQAKDPRNVDVRSDIYSLGCTLYHMLTGEPPYPEGTMLQKLLDHQGKSPPNPASKNRHVSADLAAIVQKMMASDPNKRYATPDQLIRDLMVVAGTMGLRGVNSEGLVWITSRPAPAHFWERNVGWMAMAVILLLIVFTLQRNPNWGQGIRDLDDRGTVAKTNSKENAKRQANTAAPAHNDDSDHSPDKPVDPDTDSGPHFVASIPRNYVERHPWSGDPLGRFGPLSLVPFSASNDETGTDEAPKVGPAVEPTTNDAEPFAVIGVDGGARMYRTLEAACRDAADGSVIELRYDGARANPEKPILVDKKKRITIRPARGYHPVLHFKPVEISGAGLQREMIRVVGGAVSLINLEIVVTIPETARLDSEDEPVAFLALDRPEQTRLKGVTLTVDNPAYHPATVFEVRERMAMPPESEMGRGTLTPIEIELARSFVRGNTNLALIKQAAPCRFTIADSIVAAGGSLLRVLGTRNELQEGARNELRITHTTCLLGESLITADTGTLPRRMLACLVSARNNIFASLGDQPEPLIHMMGGTNVEDFRELLIWSDAERNYYDGFDGFWVISGFDDSSELERFDFTRWKDRWGTAEIGASDRPIAWAGSWRNHAFAQLTVDDIRLDELSTDNPAVGGATDGTDAGADLSNMRFPRTLAEPIMPRP